MPKLRKTRSFAISLQYLNKPVIDETDVWYPGKQENYLQVDTMIFDRDGQAFLKFLKYKTTTNQMWSFLAGCFPHGNIWLNKDLLLTFCRSKFYY